MDPDTAVRAESCHYVALLVDVGGKTGPIRELFGGGEELACGYCMSYRVVMLYHASST